MQTIVYTKKLFRTVKMFLKVFTFFGIYIHGQKLIWKLSENEVLPSGKSFNWIFEVWVIWGHELTDKVKTYGVGVRALDRLNGLNIKILWLKIHQFAIMILSVTLFLAATFQKTFVGHWLRQPIRLKAL